MKGKPIKLSRETIRLLVASELEQARGAKRTETTDTTTDLTNSTCTCVSCRESCQL